MLAAGESAPEGAGAAILSEGNGGGDEVAMFVPGSERTLGLRPGGAQWEPLPSLVRAGCAALRAAPGSDPVAQNSPSKPGGRHGPPLGLTSPQGPARAAVLRVEPESSTRRLGAPHTRCLSEGNPLVSAPAVFALNILSGLGTDPFPSAEPCQRS